MFLKDLQILPRGYVFKHVLRHRSIMVIHQIEAVLHHVQMDFTLMNQQEDVYRHVQLHFLLIILQMLIIVGIVHHYAISDLVIHI